MQRTDKRSISKFKCQVQREKGGGGKSLLELRIWSNIQSNREFNNFLQDDITKEGFCKECNFCQVPFVVYIKVINNLKLNKREKIESGERIVKYYI